MWQYEKKMLLVGIEPTPSARGAESAVISKNFPQRQFFSPSNFAKTSLEIKIFPPTALVQTGTFCNSAFCYPGGCPQPVRLEETSNSRLASVCHISDANIYCIIFLFDDAWCWMLRMKVDMYSSNSTHTQPQIVLLLVTQKVVNIQKLSLYRCKKAVRLYVDLKALYFIWWKMTLK